MFPVLTIGSLVLPTFYLVQSLNVCLLFWWTARRSREQELHSKHAMDVGLLLAAGALVGGRLLHVLWEAPEYYREDPWRILDVGAGGFVYYGGFALGLVAALVFLRIVGEKATGRWFDLFAPVVSLGTAIGRVGCFFAGCCYGRICDLPWAFQILDDHGGFLPRHPAALYQAIWEFGVLLVLLGLEKERPARLRRPGSIFAVWAILHGVGRFLVEFVRDDFRGPAIGGASLAQVLSLILIGLALGWLARKPA